MINERVVQVDLLQKGIFVIQKVPAELAAPVGTEPLGLADKPEDTKDEGEVLQRSLIHEKIKQSINII